MLLEITDKELIKGCLDEIPAFQQMLYKRFASTMYPICLRYARNKEEAKDILQDGFILVFSKLSQFRMEGSFEGWIRRIMVNKSLEYCRKSSFLYPVTSYEGLENELADKEDILSTLESKELLKMIQELSPAYRMVFNMYVFEGMSHKEIAANLSIKESTSRKNLSDARAILRTKIKLRMMIDKKLEYNEQRGNG